MREQPPLIRDATEADLASIFAIYNTEIERGVSTFETAPKDPVRDRPWLTGREARYPVLVATDPGGDEVLGWGSLTRWSPKAGYDRTAEVSVYVDPGARKRGVGSALLQALIARAPRSDIAVLIARVTDANPASLALHASVGFEPIGTQRRSGEKFGRILDVVLMDLHLD